MKNALKALTGQHQSSARVVDGKLILSFPDAVKPVVWQMDLEQVKASALEVEDDGAAAGTYSLILRTLKGENVRIAPFQRKQQAVDGLMAASRALENAHGQIRPANMNTAHAGSQARSGRRWGVMIFVLLLIGGLLALLVNMQPRPPASMADSAAPGVAAVEPAAPAGVPQSAEDFLNGQ